MTETAPVIHWFRQDLRLADNPAFHAAAATGQPVIPLYVLDDEAPGGWTIGGASRWWLHHSLDALGKSLSRLGARLVLRSGNTVDVLTHVMREAGATAVHMTRCYEPWAAALERQVADLVTARGGDCRRFGGNLLYEPEAVTTGKGDPFKVFTPFYKSCLAGPPPKPPLAPPKAIPAPAPMPESERLEDWALLPTAPDWAGGLRDTWSPGEDGARARLDAFLEGPMGDYGALRDLPGVTGTSRLSPHLHFGEISPRQCWHAANTFAEARGGAVSKGGQDFLRELVWREFSYHLLHHWPTLPERPFRADFERFPWRADDDALRAWEAGRTGYPIVDAGMRELWHTGWMHNRVRMVVASFLVKHLLIPWQAGEAWFWDTLVDADLANNAASWQWVAGCGADAAPYFRIFNPVLQGEKFDGNGAYVRTWVPEIASLPDRYLHKPWDAPQAVLDDAGVRLGETYPAPIVDHKQVRERALAAFQSLKQSGAA